MTNRPWSVWVSTTMLAVVPSMSPSAEFRKSDGRTEMLVDSAGRCSWLARSISGSLETRTVPIIAPSTVNPADP